MSDLRLPIGENERLGSIRMALKLATRAVEKPWGRVDLPELFPNPAGRRIGEIWFEGSQGSDLPLLIKYIFTSEPLSIQVHPDDAEARARGLARGKEECWYILDCEPGATLGIGLKREVSEYDMRAAIEDGSVERLIDWKAVSPGDFFFMPAGTVHAIGAGITLVEIQQNADVTYRLYDYGRPRALHLVDGLAVSRLAPYDRDPVHVDLGRTETLLPRDSAPFQLEMLSWEAGTSTDLRLSSQSWFIPLSGRGIVGGQPFGPGECWLLDAIEELAGESTGTALIAVAANDPLVTAEPDVHATKHLE